MPTLVRPLLIAAAALIAVAAIGCAPAAPQLADRAFLSVAVTDGGAPRALVANTRLRLDFRGPNLTAAAGCNTIGAAYRIDRDTLVVDGVMTTDIGCDADLVAQDQLIAAVLGERPTVALSGDELSLAAGSIVITLRDARFADPDVPLVGPTWTVVSIIDGESVASVGGGATATLAFNDGGKLDVRPGCNQGGGTWKIVPGGIEISSIALTKKACAGAAGALESAVMTVLGAGPFTVDIDGRLMTLRAGQRGLQLRAS